MQPGHKTWWTVAVCGALTITSLVIGGTGQHSAAAADEDPRCAPGTPNLIVGTEGDDRLLGTSAADVICGLGGDDRIDGLDGDDLIIGGAGDDRIDGGAGDDRIDGGDGADTLTDKWGDDEIDGGAGNDVIDDQNGNDIVRAGDGDDIVRDAKGDDDISTGEGNDDINDSAGNDTIDAGNGANNVSAGSGNDLIALGDGDDVVDAGDGNDQISDTGGNNSINTKNGDDTVSTGDGNDSIRTGNGRDRVFSGGGDDDVDTGNDDDVVVAGNGDDRVDAGNGDDRVNAAQGNDDVDGGGGDDVCVAAETVKKCETVTDTVEDPLAPADVIELPEGFRKTVDGLLELPGVSIDVLESTGPIGRNDIAVADATSMFGGIEGVLKGAILDIEVVGAETVLSAELTIPYDPARLDPGEDPSRTLTLWTFNEDTALWEEVESEPLVDSVAETVTAVVPHFSYWTVMRREDLEGLSGVTGLADEWETVFQNFGLRCLDAGSGVGIDLAMAIDTSGSMGWNDPTARRVDAARGFVDGLSENDRVAVIDFDSTARPLNDLLALTPANRITVNANIGRTSNASGGTSISAAVLSIIAQLQDSPAGRPRVGVLLTDGDSSYIQNLTSIASALNIAIFTVGLGSGTSSSLLQGIADGTGGEFVSAATASQLSDRFQEILDSLVDDGADFDEDGITDCEERNGYLIMWPREFNGDETIDAFARLAFTDFDNSNHDFDGWRDDIEGQMAELPDDPLVAEYYQFLIDAGRTRYYRPVHGSPESSDNDEDALIESSEAGFVNEFTCGTRWWDKDTDNDLVDDGTECTDSDRDPLVPEEIDRVLPDFTLAIHTENWDFLNRVEYVFDGDRLHRRNLVGAVRFEDGYECVQVTVPGYTCDPDLEGAGSVLVTADEIKWLVENQDVFRDAGGNVLPWNDADFSKTTQYRSEYIAALAIGPCRLTYEDDDCDPGKFVDAARHVEGFVALTPAVTELRTAQTFNRVDERTGGGNGLRVDTDKLRKLIEDLVLTGLLIGHALSPATSIDPEEASDEGTRRCLETANVLSAVGTFFNGLHPCLVMPIYLPSRNDTSASGTSSLDEAVDHRADAIEDDFFKITQQYRPPAEFPFASNWHRDFEPCVTYDTQVDNCDEFPNKSMEGSGAPAQLDAEGNLLAITNTSLRVMSKGSNQLEGSRYGSGFLRVCAPTVKVARLTFLVIPMNDSGAPPTSLAVCPEGSGPIGD